MKFRRFSAALVITLSALVICILSFSALGAESSSLVNEDYNSGLGLTYAANANSLGQSAMERRTGADGGKYAVFYPTLTGSNPAHAFAEINNPDVYFNSDDDVQYLVYEFDMATETQYVSNMSFEFASRNSSEGGVFSNKAYLKKDSDGKFYLSFSGATRYIEENRGSWQHMTFIIEAERNSAAGSGSVNTVLYLYYNGEFVASGKMFNADFSYLRSMRISIAAGAAVDATDTVCLDNVKVTKLTDAYQGNLGEVLADSAKSLAEFDLSNYKDGYTFPKSAAIASINGAKYSNVSDIEAALEVGDELVILADILDKLTVPCEFVAYNPDGYAFSYDAGEFSVYTTDKSVNFIESFDSVDVKWHIGDEIKTVTYAAPELLSAPEYDEYKLVDGVQYKAIGFSRSEGGAVVNDLGYASLYNCEFWLVFAEPTVYAEHSDGTRTYGYSDSELDALMLNSKDGDTICLLRDSVACSTDNADAYNITDKSVTLDLFGYELKMSETNTYNMFTVGEGGELTVKNGVIEAPRNGRIPDGSTSILRRIIFSVDSGAEGARINAESLAINATKMIARLKTGVATFTDCEINFTGDYENMIDLYSSNNTAAPPTLNLVRCDIDTYKTVVNTYKPSSIKENISVINVTDCDIVTAERIISAETVGEVNINGGKYKCLYFFGKENLNPDAKVEISAGTQISCTKMDEKGKLSIKYDSALARVNDKEYPYVVTNECASITWSVFGNSVTQVWKRGEIPSCPIDIPKSTREIKYEFPNIEPVGSNKTYVLEASANFSLKTALELGANLRLNVYIPEMNINAVEINGIAYDKSKLPLVLLGDEAYYKIVLGAVDVSEYLSVANINVLVNSENGGMSFDTNVSILGYIEKILLGNYGDEAYELALSVLRMIADMNDGNNNQTLAKMVKTYKTDRILMPIKATDASMQGVLDAISSAVLITDGVVFFRFYLNSNYSGDLSFEFMSGAELEKFNVSVSKGSVMGEKYIDVLCDASALIEGISVRSDGGEGRFDIYLASLGSDANNLSSIYAYSRCAIAYLEGK